MATKTLKPTDHYTIISADTHAGGSHAQYREYLDKAYLDDFDAWRNKYKNPFKDLRDTSDRVRNWDSERRWNDEEHDGVVGEVIFPNTVPPFFPSFVLFAAPPAPEDYEHRLAGIRAHNRWLVDFCAEYPERRAGVGQIFLNDVDDAIDDARWCHEHGLRGGVLLPNVPPDVKWVKHLYDPYYDPLWEVCQDLGLVVASHGGTGNPDYGSLPVSQLLYITETGFYSQRPFVHTILGGVFQRFPKLKFTLTEMGCAWIPQVCAQLDQVINSIRSTKSIGELRYTDEHILQKSATEYVAQNFWVGAVSPARRTPRHARHSDPTASCGEATTRTTKARIPSRRNTCGRCSPTHRPRSSSRSSRETQPSSTTSTSTHSRPRPSGSGRPSARSPSRSRSCPRTRTRPCAAR